MEKLLKKIISDKMRQRISATAIYIKQFGIIKGLLARYKLSNHHISQYRNDTIIVNIPQSKNSISIRKKSSDLAVFNQVFLDEEYQLPIVIKPKLIIDGGAYVGYSSIYFANKYPEAKIIAVEPEISNFELLKKHTSVYPNIKAVRAGIWYRRAFLEINNPKAEKWMFQLRETNSTKNSIQAITIENIMKLENTNHINILKLDIEGAEKELFSHETQWLSKLDILILELHDTVKPGCKEAFYSAISNYNFQEFRRGENIILVKKFS